MLRKLEIAINKVLMYYSSLAYFICGWKIEENKEIKTLATDYKTLFYNPEYCESITEDELAACIIHECVHCMFLHPLYLSQKHIFNKVLPLWEIALEMATNAEVIKILDASRDKHNFSLPGKPFSPFRISRNFNPNDHIYFYDPYYAELTSLEIYERLLKKYRLKRYKSEVIVISCGNKSLTNEEIIKCPACGCEIPIEGKIKDVCPKCKTTIFRLPSVFDKVIPNDDKNNAQETIEKTIAVIEKMKKTIGSVPSGIERFIKIHLKSQVPWYRILLSFIHNIVSGAEEYRWEKPDFRHPLSDKIVMPGLVEVDLDDIIFVIDTSGSMSDNQISQIAAEISKVAQYLDEIVVITTDAAIQERIKARNLSELFKKLKFKGGGGTDFRPLFNEVKKCAAMVFFTDGFAYYPTEPPKYPVLWVLTKENAKPPFGKVCYVLDV